MCDRFQEWADSIKGYCNANGLSYQKACSMVKGSNEEMLVLQHYDPTEAKAGLSDETPMPVVLWIFREPDGLRFEQTEYTKQYLT